MCVNMGVSRTNLSREGKCIKKFQFSVYLIYQRLARKVADDELHEDEDD